MRALSFTALVLICLLTACSKSKPSNPQPPTSASLLLKDVIWTGLPSPFYHFEYNDDSDITKASFASGQAVYDVIYNDGKIAELRNNTTGNKDRLVYTYSNGKPAVIQYINSEGVNYKRCFLEYNSAQQLSRIEWELKVGSTSFAAQKTLQFSYDANKNASLVTTHHHEIDGVQPDLLFTDRYENYDSKMNADGFSLIHEEDEHLLLLPGTSLQQNNPQKVTRTGDGINYEINYSYTYNNKQMPLTRNGIMHFTNSPDADDITLSTSFTYYE